MITFLCAKITYPNKVEAKFELKNIRECKQKHKKPIRAYECPICSGWHLTSKPDSNFIKFGNQNENEKQESFIQSLQY